MPDNSAKPSPAHFARMCPTCEAPVELSAATCWLCGHALSGDVPQEPMLAAAHDGIVAPERTGGFSLAALMMFMTLACVILGISSFAPGIGVPLAGIALIVWARTADMVKSRERHGTPTTSVDKVLFYIRSFSFSIALVTLIWVTGYAALVAAIAAICAVEQSQLADQQEAYQMKTYAVIAGSIAFACPFVIFKLIQWQRRWRAEKIGVQDEPDRIEPPNPSTNA